MPDGACLLHHTGVVNLDPDRCVGCRYCTWLCPYDAPRFDPRTGIVQKCTFCSDRIAQAELSYDVAAQDLVGEKAKIDVVVDLTSDPAQAAQINPYVMNIVEKVTAHKLQTRALDEAAAGNIAGATQKLRAAATRLLA